MTTPRKRKPDDAPTPTNARLKVHETTLETFRLEITRQTFFVLEAGIDPADLARTLRNAAALLECEYDV
jgi:hypothetical protein